MAPLCMCASTRWRGVAHTHARTHKGVLTSSTSAGLSTGVSEAAQQIVRAGPMLDLPINSLTCAWPVDCCSREACCVLRDP